MAGLRIAVVGTRGIPASYGGVERHVEELYSRLAARGCESTLFCRRHYVLPEKDRVEWDIPLKRGRYRGCRLEVSSTPIAKGAEAFVHSCSATLRALSGEFDLIHFHSMGPAFFAFLPRRNGRRYAVTVHGLDWQREKWGPFGRRFLKFSERKIARRAPHVICVSRALQRHFWETYERETLYIPNGVAIPPWPDELDSPEWGLLPGGYILFFGRLTPEKGVRTLIEAFQQLPFPGNGPGMNESARPPVTKLVIAGGASPGAESHEHALRAMANDQVIFPGYVYGAALTRLIAGARFVIAPSTVEGLPIAALEAQALGKHVLASDIPPHRELIDDANWLFPPGNVARLAERLAKHIQLPAPERDAGLIQKVGGEYDWDRIAGQTLRLFRRIVERP